MAQRTLPNLGLTGFFDLGEDGWKDEMDLNLLRLSVLVQGGVIDKLPAEIVSPTAGDVIILDEAHPTEPNAVAVYDDGAWVYIAPNEGWLMYNQTEDYYEKFDGTVWAELATGGAGGVEEAPEDGTPYARQDAGWVAVTGGAGGSGSDVELSRQYKVATPGDGFIDIPLDEFDASEFEIIAHGRPSADCAIYARLSNDNAATFFSGAADYKHRASNSDNKINLVSQTVGSGRPWIAEFRLAGMNGGVETEYFMLGGTGYDVNNSGSGDEFVIGGYPNALANEDYNGIRIYCSAGNMDNISVTVVPKLRSIAAGGGTTGGKTRVQATDLLFESGNASEWGAPANFTVASTYEGLDAPGGQNAIYRTTGFGAGTFSRIVDLTSQFSDAELDAGSIFEMQTFLGRWSADNDTVGVRFQFLDGSDIAVGPEFYFTNNDNILGDIWQPKGGRFLIPAGTRKFKVTVNVTNNTGGTANVAFSGVMAWVEEQT